VFAKVGFTHKCIVIYLGSIDFMMQALAVTVVNYIVDKFEIFKYTIIRLSPDMV